MPHPGDHGCLGPLLDRDAFRPGNRAAADRRCVIRHGPGHPLGEIGVIPMKAQERDHRPQEVFDVLGLGLVTAAGVGLLLLGEALRGSLGFEIGTNRSMVAAGPTRLGRRPSGPSSPPRPNDRQRPSPGESGRHRQEGASSVPALTQSAGTDVQRKRLHPKKVKLPKPLPRPCGQ